MCSARSIVSRAAFGNVDVVATPRDHVGAVTILLHAPDTTVTEEDVE